MSEKNLDFDKITDRKNTDCLKYDFAIERGMPEDVLPLWVADMDFKTTSFVTDALKKRAEHGIFGYSEVKTEYFDVVAAWMKERHGWDIKEEWLIKTPGVVFALAMAVKAYTNEGDGVLVQSPVYYPFYEVIEDNNRRVIKSDLKQGSDGKYYMDIADFENKIRDEGIKLFLLCSPHNPVGRVWTKEELKSVGDICLKYGVTVVSDEIHMDFAFSGRHRVFTTVKKEYESIAVVCTSPSKTFNLASMLISNIFIPDKKLREAFKKQLDAAGISQLSVLGLDATYAAYKNGGNWYDKMKSYVKANIDFAEDYIEKNLPGVKMVPHEGTYLIWLDFKGTGLGADELDELIINKAGLWLDSGKVFGRAGECFQRINAACPRSILEEALRRIGKVLK